MEMSCTLPFTLVNEILIREESHKIHTLMRIFSTRNIFLVKKWRSVLHYYKNSKPSENKLRIIYLRSNTLELWKIFNLTFGGPLADITPILSVGFFFFFFFFFFVVQILSRTHENRVAYWRFSVSSILFFSLKWIVNFTINPLSCKKEIALHYCTF